MDRALAWDACRNLRDIGGYPTSDGGSTRWRSVVRSDSLCRLSPAGKTALEAYGIATVIDLRSSWEVARQPHPYASNLAPDHRPRYVNVPVHSDQERSNWLALAVMRTGELARAYRLDLELNRLRYAQIVREVAAAAEGGVVIHCEADKDRTGIAVALLLSLAGVDEQTVADEYGLSSLYWRPAQSVEPEANTRVAFQRRQWYRRMGSPPAVMISSLEYLRSRYGGVEAYLAGAGVTGNEFDALRERLRE